MSKDSHMDNFNCYICLNYPEKATLCPKCSKVSCYECITQWIAKGNNCPMCKSIIYQNELINCGWHLDIRNFIDDYENTVAKLKDRNLSLTCQLESENEWVKTYKKECFKIRSDNEKNIKEKEALAIDFAKIDKEKVLIKRESAKLKKENEDLRKAVARYERHSVVKYIEEAKSQRILTKEEIIVANIETLRLEIEKLSFKIMEKSVIMYQHLKNKETVPVDVNKEMELLTEHMNLITLEIKKSNKPT